MDREVRVVHIGRYVALIDHRSAAWYACDAPGQLQSYLPLTPNRVDDQVMAMTCLERRHGPEECSHCRSALADVDLGNRIACISFWEVPVA